ncbi:septation protein SepH, partial [Nonomuraea lactucae]|uniref:septation protein SepH n=1 Tax=Nonomuraea lactucae TaxID=2249762 RepID=UPI001962BD72
MQELRLVAVSEDGTYLVLATAGRGTRFTLPVDDRLRAAVRGNFSRLGQYEIEVESPLRPKEIQARIRAGETAEEIAATAGIPVERVRWFEGPVLQEREYVAQQAQRVAVRMPGESSAGPTLGDLVAERLTRRGVPTDEIDWDSAKRDDGLWRVKLGYVWNGHTRHAEWLFDPRRRHVTPHDDEALRLSSADFDPDPPVEDTTVTPFTPRVAKLQPVPPLGSDPLPFPSAVRRDPEPEEPAVGYHQPARGSEPAYPRPPAEFGLPSHAFDRAPGSPPREATGPFDGDPAYTPFERDPAPRDVPSDHDPAARHLPFERDPATRNAPWEGGPAAPPELPFDPPAPAPDSGLGTGPASRPEAPARDTGYPRPGDASRRGGSAAWLPDFGSGRTGERGSGRDAEAFYAPATRDTGHPATPGERADTAPPTPTTPPKPSEGPSTSEAATATRPGPSQTAVTPPPQGGERAPAPPPITSTTEPGLTAEAEPVEAGPVEAEPIEAGPANGEPATVEPVHAAPMDVEPITGVAAAPMAETPAQEETSGAPQSAPPTAPPAAAPSNEPSQAVGAPAP